MADTEWEYGFYDDADSTKYVFWYVFGIAHDTAESAAHTAHKNTWGQPVVVRRQKGRTDPHAWEPYRVAAPKEG